MVATAELGPVIGLGRVEHAIRDVLRQPQVFGVYLDEALRQTYGVEARVIRPKDIVASTQERVKLNLPGLVVQAEPAGDPQRMRDRSYAATFVIGVHCITVDGSHATARRTSDVMAAAATSMLLQRLPGQNVGEAVVSGVTWDASGQEDEQGATSSYVDVVTQLRVVVSGLMSDKKGRLPSLPANDPATGGPAPAPTVIPGIVGFAIDVDDDTTSYFDEGDDTP
jgi:hypothetical protein